MADLEKVFVQSKNENKFSFAAKVKTRAKNNAIEGTICIDDIWHLKLAIKAPKEGGKANRAIIDFLSQELNLPKKAITIAKGATSNYKVIIVEKNDC
jgi:uncharacterized protein YggU (UPF0235/DUF167 family)